MRLKVTTAMNRIIFGSILILGSVAGGITFPVHVALINTCSPTCILFVASVYMNTKNIAYNVYTKKGGPGTVSSS